MSFGPLSVRLIVSFAVAMAIIVGTCGIVIYFEGRQAAFQQQIEDLDSLNALVRPWISSDKPLSTEDQRRLLDAAKLLGVRVTLIGGDGIVQFDTHENPAHMANHNDRPEVLAARSSGVGTEWRYSDTIGRSSAYVARLVDPGRPQGLILRVSNPHYKGLQLTRSIWGVTLASIFAAMLVVMVLRRVLIGRWVGPLRQLATTAGRMAGGEWRVRADTAGADDVRVLGLRLNDLAEHAQRQFDDLQNRRQDLSALVDALPDPILFVDPQSRVSLMNSPAASLFDVTVARAMGKSLVNVVADEALLELHDSAQSSRNGKAEEDTRPARQPTSVHRTVRLTRAGQRLIYQAAATRTLGGGVLIVLRDITALAGLVQVKTDFVANASHELRTPISAIKIAFETLQDVHQEDPQQAERCIAVVAGHLKRLEEMLRDLLDLSRVETPDLKPFIKEVKPADVFGVLRSSLGTMASAKGVELRLDVESSTPASILSDERLLNLVLKNLVENSIKFTPAGGSVSVTMRNEEGTSHREGRTEILVRVTDTGIGIPPEHRDRVFERFYQVDAARTPVAGRGTGLGLAIVKHAVHALNGEVEIESVVGEGTSVTCRLPVLPPSRTAAPEPLDAVPN